MRQQHHLELRELARQPIVRATGETGLISTVISHRDRNRKSFAQLELASECGLPVFMHERDAAERQYHILRDYRDHLVDGVILLLHRLSRFIHYLDMDLHIGITG